MKIVCRATSLTGPAKIIIIIIIIIIIMNASCTVQLDLTENIREKHIF